MVAKYTRRYTVGILIWFQPNCCCTLLRICTDAAVTTTATTAAAVVVTQRDSSQFLKESCSFFIRNARLTFTPSFSYGATLLLVSGWVAITVVVFFFYLLASFVRDLGLTWLTLSVWSPLFTSTIHLYLLIPNYHEIESSLQEN